VSKPVVQEGGCKAVGALTAALDVFAGNATTDSAVQMSCAKGYDQCKAGLASDAGANNSACAKPKPTCTATVREYEACANDSVGTFEQFSNELPACKDMKLSDVRTGDAGSSMPPIQSAASCQALETKCPELFSSTPH